MHDRLNVYTGLLTTDMLQKAGEIHLNRSGLETQGTPSPQQLSSGHTTLLDHTQDSPMSLLVGSTHSLDTVQLVDINTKHPLFEVGGHTQRGNEGSHSNKRETTPLHGLALVDGTGGHVFVTCSGEPGVVKLWDIRVHITKDSRTEVEKLGEHTCPKTDKSMTHVLPSYALAVSKSCSLSDAKVAVLGSGGQVLIYDCRDVGVPIMKCCVKGEDRPGAFRSRFTTAGRISSLCVQVSWVYHTHTHTHTHTSLTHKHTVTCMQTCSITRDSPAVYYMKVSIIIAIWTVHLAHYLQFSPSRKALLSVSGIGRGIQVYDTSSWSDHMTQGYITVAYNYIMQWKLSIY